MHYEIMMNDDTRFLLKRMDEMERRLMKRIDVLWNFRIKIIGGAMVISAFVSVFFELVKGK